MSKLSKRLDNRSWKNNAASDAAAAPEPAPGLATGPRTPEGKAVSSQNARKHGFTGKSIHVPDALRPEFEELRDGLLAQIQPDGAIENLLYERLLHAAWNLRRIELMEEHFFAHVELLEDPATAKQFDRFQRYRATHERSFYRALSELEKRQTNRALREDVTDELPETTPPLTAIKDFAKRTQIRKAVRRPDPQIEQIDRELDRMEAEIKLLDARETQLTGE